MATFSVCRAASAFVCANASVRGRTTASSPARRAPARRQFGHRPCPIELGCGGARGRRLGKAILCLPERHRAPRAPPPRPGARLAREPSCRGRERTRAARARYRDGSSHARPNGCCTTTRKWHPALCRRGLSSTDPRICPPRSSADTLGDQRIDRRVLGACFRLQSLPRLDGQTYAAHRRRPAPRPPAPNQPAERAGRHLPE